jgi:hypothetical protein
MRYAILSLPYRHHYQPVFPGRGWVLSYEKLPFATLKFADLPAHETQINDERFPSVREVW